jgi:hypothetical protein
VGRPYLNFGSVKLLALKVLPPAAVRILRNSYYQSLRRWIRTPKLVVPIAKRLEFKVQAGPFAGMLYSEEMVRADVESPLLPKLLGSYELECHSFVEAICFRTYDQVINIGAGEGYYAVGLALRLPRARVIAFERHARSRELCIALARLNRVQDRVEVRGSCDRQSLAAAIGAGIPQRTVVVCDCEGAEIDLLQPELIPALAGADVLVELHDFVDPEISEAIKRRFSRTHRLEMVRSWERDPDAYAALAGLSAEDRRFLISEHRLHRTDWLFGTAGAREMSLARRNADRDF